MFFNRYNFSNIQLGLYLNTVLFPTVIYFTIFYYAVLSVFCFSALSFVPDLYLDRFFYFQKKLRYLLEFICFIDCVLLCFNLKKILFVLLFLLIDRISYKTICSHMIFDLFFVALFLSKFLSAKRVYKLFLFALVVSVSAVLILYFLNLFPVYHDKYYSSDGIRYCWGFRHPNQLGLLTMVIGMLYVLVKERIYYYDCFVLLCLSLFCYEVPKSSSSFVILLLLSVFIKFAYYYEVNSVSIRTKVIFFVLGLLFFIFFISSVYFVSFTNFGREILSSIKNTLFVRFSSGLQAYEEYGFSIWGQHIETSSTISSFLGNSKTTLIVDCTYFLLPIEKGLVASFVFVWVYILSMVNAINKNRFRLYLLQLLVILYSITENVVINSNIFIFLFISSFVLIEKNKGVLTGTSYE